MIKTENKLITLMENLVGEFKHLLQKLKSRFKNSHDFIELEKKINEDTKQLMFLHKQFPF